RTCFSHLDFASRIACSVSVVSFFLPIFLAKHLVRLYCILPFSLPNSTTISDPSTHTFQTWYVPSLLRANNVGRLFSGIKYLACDNRFSFKVILYQLNKFFVTKCFNSSTAHLVYTIFIILLLLKVTDRWVYHNEFNSSFCDCM